MFASWQGNHSTVKTLIKYNAYINDEDEVLLLDTVTVYILHIQGPPLTIRTLIVANYDSQLDFDACACLGSWLYSISINLLHCKLS